MEVKYKVLLGLPPHNFDEKHPLFLNFGIFFHLDTKSSVDEEYMHINDWLSTQNSILNFASLVEFKKFIQVLHFICNMYIITVYNSSFTTFSGVQENS